MKILSLEYKQLCPIKLYPSCIWKSKVLDNRLISHKIIVAWTEQVCSRNLSQSDISPPPTHSFSMCPIMFPPFAPDFNCHHINLYFENTIPIPPYVLPRTYLWIIANSMIFFLALDLSLRPTYTRIYSCTPFGVGQL